MKRVILLTSMAIALAGVAGCSGTQGHPEPTGGTPTGVQTSISDPAGSSTSPTTATNIADTNACSLLTAAEATSVGLPSSGNTDNLTAKSGCEWDGSSYTVGIFVYTTGGLSSIPSSAGTPTNTQIGSHSAVQLTVAAGGCIYSIGINDSTRVDVNAEGNGQNSCPESLAVAQLVEKHLPS